MTFVWVKQLNHSFNRAIQMTLYGFDLSFLLLFLSLEQTQTEHCGIHQAEQKILSEPISSRKTPCRSSRLGNNSYSLIIR